MKKIFYEKQGHRYVPVREYDPMLSDALPQGFHLLEVRHNSESRRFDVDPDTVALLAAGLVAKDAMVEALSKATELRPMSKPLTESQRQAWEAFIAEMGDEGRMLERDSLYNIAEAGIQRLMEESQRLLTNEALRKAYDNFILLTKLSKEA